MRVIFVLLINRRLSIEQALQLSNEARAILNTQGNVDVYISQGCLSVERALQMTSVQRNLLNNINPHSDLNFSIHDGRRNVDEVLRELEQRPLEQSIKVIDETRQLLNNIFNQMGINQPAFIRQMLTLSNERGGQFLQTFLRLQNDVQPTAQDITNASSGIGYERARFFCPQVGDLDNDDITQSNRINRLVDSHHLARNEASNLNAQEWNIFTTSRIFDLVISNQLSVTDASALTEEQRSRLENGEAVAEVIDRRGPSIQPMD